MGFSATRIKKLIKAEEIQAVLAQGDMLWGGGRIGTLLQERELGIGQEWGPDLDRAMRT